MMNELDALEDKVAQIVDLCHSLRAKNAELQMVGSQTASDKIRSRKGNSPDHQLRSQSNC